MSFFVLAIFSLCLVSGFSSDDLTDLLSNDTSQEWLKNISDASASDNPYCHLCCMDISRNTVGKNCGLHTMCIYKESMSGPACRGYIAIPFTDVEKLAIVDAHNTLRNRIASGKEPRGNPGSQPGAANMRVMEWDDELTKIAERWAAQCIYSNDYCRDLAKFPVGQNIARGNFTRSNELVFIKRWFDNIDLYSSQDVSRYYIPPKSKKGVAHYTQMMWADTYKIGCARAIFQRTDSGTVVYVEHFICNYGPTGNIPNQPVYLIGAPCTMCPEDTSCTIDYPNLCGNGLVWALRGADNFDEDKSTDIIQDNAATKSFFVLVIYIGPALSILEFFIQFRLLL